MSADEYRFTFGKFGPKNFPPDGLRICDVPIGDLDNYLSWLEEQPLLLPEAKKAKAEILAFITDPCRSYLLEDDG